MSEHCNNQSSLKTKEQPYFKNNLFKSKDFSSHFKKSAWGSTSTVWLPTFYKISFFEFSRRKKFIQVWNNL